MSKLIKRWSLTLLVFASFGAQAAAPLGQWWYTNFDHRYKISVPAGAAALATGYAVPVSFNHAGAVTAGESVASGDDVRVVYWNGTTWVELDRVLDPDGAWNSASTVIWFKTQAGIAAGITDDNYYLYYGDTAVPGTPLQDPEVVWSLFDDFSGAFDTTRWSRSNNTNVTVAGGVLTINGGRQLRSVATFGLNTIYEVRSLVANTAPSAPNYYLAGDNDCTDYVFDSYIRFRADNTAVDTVNASPGTTTPAVATFTPTSPTAFQYYSFTREAAGAGRFFHNGTQLATFTGANVGAMCMFMRNEAGTTTHTQQYDWTRVRPYRNPEPVPALAPAAELLAMPSVVGEWRLDQTSWTGVANDVLDSGPNVLNMKSFNGAVTANTTPAIAGDPGSCRYGNFDGVDDYLEVADNAALDLPNQVSVSAWVYPRSLPAAGLLKSIWSKDTNYEMHLNSSGQVDWWWGGGTQELITTVAVPLNQWSHIAVTYQSGMQRIYVNGVLRASGTVVGALTTNTNPFQIGQDQGFAARYWNGLIDEVRVYGAALSAAQVNSIMTEKHACSTAHHFLIAHDGYGITCAAVENVRVTVHDISHNAITTYNKAITLDTQSGRGTWTLVSGSGVFADATPNDGLATYIWPLGQDHADFALDYRSATPPGIVPPGTLSLDIDAYETANPSMRDDDTEGTLKFSPSGFVVTSTPLSNPPPNPIPSFGSPQIAGTVFNAYITAYGQTPTDTTCGVIEGYAGARSVKFWHSYVNPVAGTRNVAINGTTIFTNSATAAALPVNFVDGQATVTALYADAGMITIQMRDDATSTGNLGLPNGIAGNTGNFVVRPSTFLLTNIKRTSDNFVNPGTGGAVGPIFIAAGQPFTATVTAVDSTGAATPNFGQEIVKESVALTPTLVAPSGGQNPAVASTTGFVVPFNSGVSTGTDFSWPEVGAITLTPHIKDGDYLGIGDVTGTVTGNVGRFIPNSFGTSKNTPSLTTACAAGTFTYVGQPFSYVVAPVITVTALALGGATTKNYTSTFFKLTSASLATAGPGSSAGRIYSAATGTLNGVPSIASDPVVADLTNGVATLSYGSGSGFSFARATPVPPFNAQITLSQYIVDADGVAAVNPISFANIAFNSGSEQRYGRVAFRNAVGSELLNLPLSMHAEYFLSAAAGFVQNNSDNTCTTGVTIPVPAAAAYGGNLNVGETCLLDTGSPGVSGFGCSVAGASAQQFKMPPVMGDFNAVLRAPGSTAGTPNTGTVTIRATVPTWLQFDWFGAGMANPQGIATFGVFQGESKRIFQIEK